MSDLSVGNHADVVLSPGDVLRVSTGGVATVVVAYGAPAGTTTITANTQDFGPYSVPAKLAVNAVTGTASYANVAAYPVVKMPDGTLQAGGSPVDGAGKTATIDVILTQFDVDPSGDATGALRRANAYILARGVGTISIPKDREYLISDNVELGIGINLAGPGRVRRTHPLAVSGYAFTLLGENTIEGLEYSGGWGTIPTPGLNLSIKDFLCVGNNISFRKNVFKDSCGSFIQQMASQYAVAQTLSGLDIRGNTFGDYADHCLYAQGYELVKTGDINFQENTLVATSITTRQAVKLKNINNALVTGNKFQLPSGVFATVELGLDGGLIARNCENVTISNNIGTCWRFLESIAAGNAANRGFFVNNLTITANTAKCSEFGLSLGFRPDGSTGVALRLNNCLISNNVIESAVNIINGDMNGVNNGVEFVSFSNNLFTTTTGSTSFETYGNIKLINVSGNTFRHTASFDQANALFNRKTVCDLSGGAYIPTIVGHFEVIGNILAGNFGCYFSEQPSGANTSINFTCELTDNRHMGDQATKRLAVLTSTVIASATGVIVATNNRCIGGSASASACTNKALLLESDSSKRYVAPATTGDRQFGHYAVYVCGADLGFNPLTLAAGIYYHAYRKGDGTYVRVA